ncbi:MAG: S-layer homology domain-containing protein [Acidimicrobiia bacterium]|nr:S-layer homology domain-containing protein [Acidimicrobiia bacterium]
MRHRHLTTALVATLLLVATGAAPTTASFPASDLEGRTDEHGSFSDVPPGHPFAEEISWLVEQDITTGFGDGTFRPTIAVSRQAMAAFLWRLAGQPHPHHACNDPFSDVPTDHPFAQPICWLIDTGTTTGFGDGTFRPTIAVSRQATAAFLQRYEGWLADRCPDRPLHLNRCASVAFDFTGDGRADPVWVNEGAWYLGDDPTPLATFDVGGSAGPWIPVAGDYNGDGITTPAIADLTTGEWWWAMTDGSVVAVPDVPWPPVCDSVSGSALLPVPADYTGNGRTDPAWYCTLGATWHLPGNTTITFGTPTDWATDAVGDIPVPADYTGDGQADLAVYDPTMGRFHLEGEELPLAVHLGAGLPMAADLDGDGRATPMVFSVVTGEWRIAGGGAPSERPEHPADTRWPAVGDWNGDAQSAPATFSLGTSDVGGACDLRFHFLDDTMLDVADAPCAGGAHPASVPAAGVVMAPHVHHTETVCATWAESFLDRALLGDPFEDPAELGFACPGVGTPGDVTGDGLTDRVFLDGWSTSGSAQMVPADDVGPVGAVTIAEVVLAPGATVVVPVPADYSGNGRTEVAFVTSAGEWITTAGTVGTLAPPPCDVQWEVASPVPADYSGDGRAEPAWYCEMTATWHFADRDPVVFGEVPTTAFDLDTLADVPLPADYTGDGRADLAVYRPLTGEVLVQGVSEPVATGMGIGFPSVVDLDGDGRFEPLALVDLRDVVPHANWHLPGDVRLPHPSETREWALPAPGRYQHVRTSTVAALLGDTSRFRIGTAPPITIDNLDTIMPVTMPPAVLVSLARLTFGLDQCTDVIEWLADGNEPDDPEMQAWAVCVDAFSEDLVGLVVGG